MVQLNYGKLNALYETFVPQQEPSAEQTYFSIPSTYNICSETKEVTSDLPIPKMPKESKLLKMFEKMGLAINDLQKRIDVTLLEDRKMRWMSDSQNSLREFYKTDVIPMSESLSTNLNELNKNSLKKYMKCVESFNSVRRPKSKDTKSKDRVLKNTNDKRPSANVQKMSSSVSIDSNKRETMHSNLSHEKCVAHYALSKYSKVKRALFTTPIEAGCKNLGATSIVAKSRLSVAKTPTTTNKAIQPVLWIVDSGCSKHMTGNLSLLRNFIEKFMGTVRFENDHFAAITASRCYPQNDCDDLGKMKPKADIGIFIGYSKSSRGFRIYNRQTKMIMETIHVKFDELTIMAFECNNSEPEFNYLNFQDSSEDLQSVPLKTDLDNLFGPLYEEYYSTSPPEVSDNSAANTLYNEDTSSSSSIVVEEDEAPQIVSLSAEQVFSKPDTPVLNDNANELVQEDVAELEGNAFYNLPQTHVFEEAESSSTY
ncbi:retrovirus-related pol polyprotein from transposon TNT 1-94 [Tanacetum coccineum]